MKRCRPDLSEATITRVCVCPLGRARFGENRLGNSHPKGFVIMRVIYGSFVDFSLSRPLFRLALLRGGHMIQVVRTNELRQKACVPCLHNTFGSDYCVPPR